ncbi:MAG: circadian clock protein KaiA [Oscillatoriales cyanobacterium]|nr:MAG: circadian clock protein KaiA [Oscillatoriales cyanobacterium]
MVTPTLTICIFALDVDLIDQIRTALDDDRFAVTVCHSPTEFIETLSSDWSHFDSLILEAHDGLPDLVARLHQAKLVLPAIILTTAQYGSGNDPQDSSSGNRLPSTPRDRTSPSIGQSHFYHQAEVYLTLNPVNSLEDAVTQALAQFLQLSPSDKASPPSFSSSQKITLLEEKQRLLTEKLKERLGYLGVYYKRNSQRFLRNLSAAEAIDLIEQLQVLYQDIVLQYFDKGGEVNQAIDEFVYLAFFADISVTRVVELHMNLMDQFSKQLQLEGRSEEILLDYRLTLIDVIAHLCEMYRRSIPREPE